MNSNKAAEIINISMRLLAKAQTTLELLRHTHARASGVPLDGLDPVSLVNRALSTQLISLTTALAVDPEMSGGREPKRRNISVRGISAYIEATSEAPTTEAIAKMKSSARHVAEEYQTKQLKDFRNWYIGHIDEVTHLCDFDPTFKSAADFENIDNLLQSVDRFLRQAAIAANYPDGAMTFHFDKRAAVASAHEFWAKLD